MESAPPSYEAATVNNVWSLVARYVSSPDLPSTTLVSKKWHDTYSKELWGCPTNHFPTQYDGSHDGLARFQRCLVTTRLQIRSLVHTLRISSHGAVYYDQRPPDWLRKLFSALPNLQSLIVTGLSFFDHDTMQAAFANAARSSPMPSLEQDKLQTSSPSSITPRMRYGEYSNDLGFQTRRLRLLDASRCKNLTASSLAAALETTTHLIYLDLSYVIAARGATLWSGLHDLYQLKVLKLQGIGLDDKEIDSIASAIKRRVPSLDVRHNRITINGLNMLLDKCFGAEIDNEGAQNSQTEIQIASAIERSVDSFDKALSSILTAGHINRLTIEDAPHLGIQHLAISGNALHLSSLTQLLQCPLLIDLDVGNLTPDGDVKLQLDFSQAQGLSSLRVDHAVILQPQYMGLDDTKQDFLRPSMLSKIKTLVLTDVPAVSATPMVSKSIISLIEGCAEEAARAKTHALSDYTLPPGQQGNSTALRHSAAQMFALETIVLEITMQPRDEPFGQGRAVTEDFDSEAMWSAGQSDYSFFRDDVRSRNKTTRTSARAGASRYEHASHDVVAAVSIFRKARRMAHECNTGRYDPTVSTSGHWDGVVKVLRQ